MFLVLDIDTSFSFYYKLFIKLFGLQIVQVWSINYTLCFRHGQIYEHYLYWIAFSADMYRKINVNCLLRF